MIFPLLSLLSLLPLALSLDLDPTSAQSVNSDSKLIANGLLHYYAGSQYGGTIGMFVQPYYWWHAGVAWNSMVEYWAVTGDDTYLDTTRQALIAQRGEKFDLMVANYSTSEGNDDQGMWALTMLAAAERGFPGPNDGHSWLDVAKNAFETMIGRWDTSTCGGGVRWQIFSTNNGYDYKNTVSNGAIFSIAARLYYNTGDERYLQWANTAWDWLWNSGLIDHDSYRIQDGLDVNDCSKITPFLWSYNAGMLQSGTAYLYAATGDQAWDNHASKFWNSAKTLFFNNKVMVEIACQQNTITCNNDQRTFKGVYSSLLGLTAEVHPGLAGEIIDYLTTSAKAAASACTSDGTCSLNWLSQSFDGNWVGLGEQISALSVIINSQALKIHNAPRQKTGSSGQQAPQAQPQAPQAQPQAPQVQAAEAPVSSSLPGPTTLAISRSPIAANSVAPVSAVPESPDGVQTITSTIFSFIYVSTAPQSSATPQSQPEPQPAPQPAPEPAPQPAEPATPIVSSTEVSVPETSEVSTTNRFTESLGLLALLGLVFIAPHFNSTST